MGGLEGIEDRKLIPYRPASPEAPDLLTNGDFRRPITGSGFDWRYLGPAGIYLEREGAQAALAIGFTGEQAESAEILSQYVRLLPLRRYALSVRYRAKDIGADSGVRCFLIRLTAAICCEARGSCREVTKAIRSGNFTLSRRGIRSLPVWSWETGGRRAPCALREP